MAALKSEPARQVCDEPVLDEDGEPTGEECGRVHVSISPTCPECRWRLTDAFWATMGTTTPDTGARLAQLAPAPPQPKKRRNRPGRKRRAKGNDHG